jgi:prenyltransferase beta subunit
MIMDAIARAREYLVGSQRLDGSWGSGDPLVCARALYALHDGMPEDTTISGLRYMEGRQQPDGRFLPKTRMYSDASSTAYSLIVLNKFDYGKASLPVSRGILWLLESQNDDGSWGTNKKKKAYTTTFCLRALHTFYLSGINRYARGLDFALKYMEGLDLYNEPVSHVYAPVLNLKRMGMLEDALEKRFIEYAGTMAQKSVDDGHVSDAAYILGTLKALGEPEMPLVIEEWLMATQNDDGGFGKDLASPSDPNWTALVVLSSANKL